ncbi:MAG: hypothetical protein LBH97_04950 [Treponema sp.]|nr:hypothetical protein [Treponema sp.]
MEELSKTVFGRTDLPQFYCGASKLQNFDVIPTGGLWRRSGMEHLKTLDKEGRLIPFIVRRDLHFLLLLALGKITVYKLVNGEIAVHPDGTPDVDVYASNQIRRVYENMEHIRDVQYAQNYDTMILCHEDYAPLEVLLTDTGSLGIRSMTIDNPCPSLSQSALSVSPGAPSKWPSEPNRSEKPLSILCTNFCSLPSLCPFILQLPTVFSTSRTLSVCTPEADTRP